MAKQELQQGRNWFVIHTYAGYEEAVAKSLLQRVENLGMQDKIFNVLVPHEKKVKIKNGKRIMNETIPSSLHNKEVPWKKKRERSRKEKASCF